MLKLYFHIGPSANPHPARKKVENKNQENAFTIKTKGRINTIIILNVLI